MTTNQTPLILISPPSSEEAREIGYINVPKIVKDPPEGLFGPEGLHDFKDGTGYVTEPSNIWISKIHIEELGLSIEATKL